MTIFGTAVRNPMRRNGPGYVPCCYCQKLFTQQGISRHWDHCPMNPKNQPKEKSNGK